MSVPKVTIVVPTLDMEVEEGEISRDKALSSLKGKEVASSSSVPPSDKEVEMLEAANIDETAKLRLF